MDSKDRADPIRVWPLPPRRCDNAKMAVVELRNAPFDMETYFNSLREKKARGEEIPHACKDGDVPAYNFRYGDHKLHLNRPDPTKKPFTRYPSRKYKFEE